MVQKFPQVEFEGKLMEEVSVTYFVTKEKPMPLDPNLWREITEDKKARSVDFRSLPIAMRLGFVLLESGESCTILTIEEPHTIWMVEADWQGGEVKAYQPIHGPKAKISTFRSKRVVEKLLTLPGVKLTDAELYPWRHYTREQPESKTESK